MPPREGFFPRDRRFARRHPHEGLAAADSFRVEMLQELAACESKPRRTGSRGKGCVASKQTGTLYLFPPRKSRRPAGRFSQCDQKSVSRRIYPRNRPLSPNGTSARRGLPRGSTARDPRGRRRLDLEHRRGTVPWGHRDRRSVPRQGPPLGRRQGDLWPRHRPRRSMGPKTLPLEAVDTLSMPVRSPARSAPMHGLPGNRSENAIPTVP